VARATHSSSTLLHTPELNQRKLERQSCFSIALSLAVGFSRPVRLPTRKPDKGICIQLAAPDTQSNAAKEENLYDEVQFEAADASVSSQA